MHTISFDFCFLTQKDQAKSIPTLAAIDHKSCYTHAFTCPGKSTKEEEYSEDIVHKCKMFVEMLGYKRVAIERSGDSNEGTAAARSKGRERRDGAHQL